LNSIDDELKRSSLHELLKTAIATTDASLLTKMEASASTLAKESLTALVEKSLSADNYSVVNTMLEVVDKLRAFIGGTDLARVKTGCAVVRDIIDVRDLFESYRKMGVDERISTDPDYENLLRLKVSNVMLDPQLDDSNGTNSIFHGCASLLAYGDELGAMIKSCTDRIMEKFEVEYNAIMDGPYNRKDLASKSLKEVIGGSISGESWCDQLKDTDGYKEVRKIAAGSVVNINLAAFGDAVDKLNSFKAEVALLISLYI